MARCWRLQLGGFHPTIPPDMACGSGRVCVPAVGHRDRLRCRPGSPPCPCPGGHRLSSTPPPPPPPRLAPCRWPPPGSPRAGRPPAPRPSPLAAPPVSRETLDLRRQLCGESGFTALRCAVPGGRWTGARPRLSTAAFGGALVFMGKRREEPAVSGLRRPARCQAPHRDAGHAAPVPGTPGRGSVPPRPRWRRSLAGTPQARVFPCSPRNGRWDGSRAVLPAASGCRQPTSLPPAVTVAAAVVVARPRCPSVSPPPPRPPTLPPAAARAGGALAFLGYF